MIEARYGHGSVMTDDKQHVYVFGGHGKEKKSIEKLNITEHGRQWQMLQIQCPQGV